VRHESSSMIRLQFDERQWLSVKAALGGGSAPGGAR
jgi:hypothetical protein